MLMIITTEPMLRRAIRKETSLNKKDHKLTPQKNKIRKYIDCVYYIFDLNMKQ